MSGEKAQGISPYSRGFPPPGDGAASLDDWVGQLPDGHRAKVELRQLRLLIEKQQEEILRQQNEQ